MAGPTPTVKRADIRIEEGVIYYPTFTEYGADDATSVYWTATLDGHTSTGERVVMARESRQAVQALKNLEAAIREQGWEIE